MASSLTIAQKIALFEVLEVPYSDGYYQTDGMGSLASGVGVSNTEDNAKDSIETYLDTLDDTNGETELIAYINRWIAIGTKTTSIGGGSIGAVQGIEFNFDNERNLLANRIKTIVPYYRFHEVQRRVNDDGGVTIRVIR